MSARKLQPGGKSTRAQRRSRRSASRFTRRPSRTFIHVLRDFLTPALWKQAQQLRKVGRSPRSSRWTVQPLILALLCMTWCCGDSQPERFETAKAFCIACTPKRRRPGKTVQGFQKALAHLPMNVLRLFGTAFRQTLLKRLAQRCYEGEFIPIGCDGSRVQCPRTTELEQHLGEAGKKDSAPSIWVTALVLLRRGVPLAWRIGKGTASERWHLQQMLSLLPRAALLVADAGYVGYELAKSLMKNHQFLIRMSSTVTLFTAAKVRLSRFREGVVYYWPQKAQPTQQMPLRLRLLRIRGRKKKHDVWLLTNVMESSRLTIAMASNYYRWRWENEGQFRAYKQTLNKIKLVSRSVRLVHREAEGTLLAMQLMLSQAALAMPQRTTDGGVPVCSPRKVLLTFRDEIDALAHGEKRTGAFCERLGKAQRERRVRSSPKATRVWPRRKPHKPPQPPKILTLTEQQKARISQLETQAA
jgi:Transposase DDE domain